VAQITMLELRGAGFCVLEVETMRGKFLNMWLNDGADQPPRSYPGTAHRVHKFIRNPGAAYLRCKERLERHSVPR
jgi:hypothetical protein